MRTAALFAVLVSGACAPPDEPPALADAEPPGALIEALRPDTTRSVRVAEGVWYRYLWSPAGPWAVHLLEADLRRCELGLSVATAPKEEGKRGGHALVSEMAPADAAGVVGAVNGDFFTPEGLPLGPEAAEGGVRRLRDRPALAWRPGAAPWVGTVRLEGDSAMRAGWRVRREDPPGVHVVGGWPELLDRGRRVGDLLVEENPSFAASRHPRTAVAWDRDERTAWLVVVDGRQGGYSVGMTLPELADLAEALGAEEALNLDGGGSSVMVIRGRPVSRPSDEEGERPVVNALVLRRDAAYCGARREASRPGGTPR